MFRDEKSTLQTGKILLVVVHRTAERDMLIGIVPEADHLKARQAAVGQVRRTGPDGSALKNSQFITVLAAWH